MEGEVHCTVCVLKLLPILAQLGSIQWLALLPILRSKCMLCHLPLELHKRMLCRLRGNFLLTAHLVLPVSPMHATSISRAVANRTGLWCSSEREAPLQRGAAEQYAGEGAEAPAEDPQQSDIVPAAAEAMVRLCMRTVCLLSPTGVGVGAAGVARVRAVPPAAIEIACPHTA
jgi:hypothetical protein